MDDPAVEAREDAAVANLGADGASRYAAAPVPYGTEPEHVAEHYGDPAAPPLVLVHGGFFRPSIDRSHARPAAAALAEAGWSVHLPEYRRVPGDPWASVHDLVAFARELGSEAPEAPGVWVGHSAGGTLALLRAMDLHLPRVTAVVALAGVVDLVRADRERLGDGAIAQWVGMASDADPAAYAALDPLQRTVSGDLGGTPIALVHGSDDQTVPVAHSLDFPAPATVLRGAHHLDLMDPDSPHWLAVVAAIRAVAGP
jgi:acetyl esterase/lipase